jgi:hypothetical protein
MGEKVNVPALIRRLDRHTDAALDGRRMPGLVPDLVLCRDLLTALVKEAEGRPISTPPKGSDHE